ncbi:MAG: glycosidase [Bacteroidales bacterium]|nr:glycosidase [Bacteroidales bacterium]
METTSNKKVTIKRKRVKIERDVSRVITRLHIPENIIRIKHIVDRISPLPEEESERLYAEIVHRFSERHRDLENIFLEHYNEILNYTKISKRISDLKKRLIGAYFTMEYSIESAAIFNPSIIKHPNQSNLLDGECRFIMSLRATGEGHISSVVFRSGIIDKSSSVIFDPISEYVSTPHIVHDRFYDSHLFKIKLNEIGAWDNTSKEILKHIPEKFSFQELRNVINSLYSKLSFANKDKTINIMYWIANSNYFKMFNADSNLSERVIFPVSEHEIGGIEDARFVEFCNDSGESTYYATYTAYNGTHILPHLLETTDFLNFNIVTLNGEAAKNKGMALFPRKINGKYAMLSRVDGENNFIMFSDNIHFWNEAIEIQRPKYPWEFIQIGNCGSPIETDEGWLVLTHGVGAVRQYSISAILLDLEDPTKVIKSLKEPLLSPNEAEREGYVPNVVYSCGSMIHGENLFIPYAMSDVTSGIATVNVKDLIDNMEPEPH